jgi:mRNA deadenylase 3'-5' endonuclease subunit Ccr4
MAEDYITQFGNLLGNIQRGQAQWEHGKYGGPSPRYEQELTNLTTKWQGVFNYLDVGDSSTIQNAYKELEDDFNDYSRIYPQGQFQRMMVSQI